MVTQSFRGSELVIAITNESAWTKSEHRSLVLFTGEGARRISCQSVTVLSMFLKGWVNIVVPGCIYST